MYTCGSVMNAPPSSGQLTCCGSCEIVVSLAVTSRAADKLAAALPAPSRGAPAYRNGRRNAGRRIELQLDQSPHALQAVAEHEPGPLHRAEQVAHHRKAAALHAREQQGRPAGGTHAAMNLGHFQPGVDLGIDAHQLPVPLEIVDAFA